MDNFKIVGGTPKSGKSLCLSCAHACIIRGQNMEERIVCNPEFGVVSLWSRYSSVVRFKVSECGQYQPKNHPSLNHMKQIAWEVTARKRGPTGFETSDPGELVIEIKSPSDRKG